MTIENITIRNVMGQENFSVDDPAGVLLVAGPNASGKSSVLHAMRFGATALPPAGLKVGELPQLVRRGQSRAGIKITMDGESYGHTVGTRKGIPLPGGANDLLIGQWALRRMPEKEISRRMADLLGAELTTEKAMSAIKAVGCSAPEKTIRTTAEEIASSGWDVARKKIVSLIHDARVAWEATTDQKFGENKAREWQAEGVDQAELNERLEKLRREEKTFTLLHDAWLKHQSGKKNREDLEHKANFIGQIKDRLEKAEDEVVRLNQVYTDLHNARAQLVTSDRVIQEHACTECGSVHDLVFCPPHDGEPPRLVPISDVVVATEEEIRTFDRKRAEALGAVKDAQKRVESLDSSEKVALEAKAQLEAMDDQEAAPKDVSTDLAEIRGKIEQVNREIGAAGNPATVTEKAAAIYGKWSVLTAVLEAIQPGQADQHVGAGQYGAVIAAMEKFSSIVAPGYSVRFEGGFGLTLNGDTLSDLHSTSEQWLGWALFLLALGDTLNAPIVGIDGVDVLQPSRRGKFIQACATARPLVVATATLKEPPKGNQQLTVVWTGFQ